MLLRVFQCGEMTRPRSGFENYGCKLHLLSGSNKIIAKHMVRWIGSNLVYLPRSTLMFPEVRREYKWAGAV